MGFFSRLGNRIKQAASRAVAPFRRSKPPQAPPTPQPPQAPPAPRPSGPVHTPGPSSAPKSQGQMDQELKDAKLQARLEERARRMEEERQARSEANRLKNLNSLSEDGATMSDDETSSASAVVGAVPTIVQRNSKAWEAAQKYIDSEGVANLGAQTFTVRSGKHRGETHSRPSISKYSAIDNASAWFKKLDDTGVLFTWNIEKMVRGRKQIVETKGYASNAYLAEDADGYHSGAPGFQEIWDRLSGLLDDVDTEVMPYRGIW